jgi:hypothetical protein
VEDIYFTLADARGDRNSLKNPLSRLPLVCHTK